MRELKRIGYNNQYDTLEDISKYFRMLLDEKKCIVLFAYNGTGKTRLSVEFKSLGQHLNEATGEKNADTLYYNAFTEDLFYWDNDLDNDTERVIKLNSSSRFFSGLNELEMESRIRPLLHRYADFDFSIDYENSSISFSRNELLSGTLQRVDNIKISRGEENIFIWCFFLNNTNDIFFPARKFSNNFQAFNTSVINNFNGNLCIKINFKCRASNYCFNKLHY